MSRSIDLDFIILWNFKYIYKTKQKQQSDKRSWKTVSIVVCVCVCVAITVRSLKLFLLRSLSRVTIVMLINTVLRFTIHTKRISNHTANLVQYFCLFVCWFIYLIFVWKYAHIHNMPSYTYLIVVFFSLDFRRL